MAIVYRGVADATFPEGEEVAIKLIHARLDKDSDYHLRFKEEINITSRLNHPSIVRVLDYGEHKGMPYLVMELVSGTPLNRAIQGPMAIDRFQALFGSLVDAIDYAHRQGVVHRDLKPPNIMLTQSDRVFIMDFGVAFTGDRRLVRTQTGAMLGTPAYMAPEQFDNEPATAMADQYSLGMTGFWMLTGRLPVTEDNQYAMIVEKLMSELPGPRNFRPDVPPAIDGMIVRMMSRKPEARFDSMAAVAAALRTMVLAALLLLGWGGMATAQTGTMGPLDDVWPPGAVVYLESATGPVALGPANAALPIPAGPAALQIEIQADGYAPYLATIVPGDKAAASLPRPLRLVPIAFSSAMATLWHLFPIPCCALVATPVLLLSLYLAARLWLRTLAARIDRLEGRRPAAARTGSAPSRLAGYEIIRVLGEGGMAVVYEGRREGAAKAPRVAIKVIRPAHEDATEYVLRFRREVSILARLTHPGIVSVIDFGEHHGLPYLVMELIEGESVGRVATRQPVDLPMALDICRGVLDAVGYAHSQGILHRDLKPNNVMIRKNGQPVVLDFGIANVDSGKQLLTQTGALLGTPAYMAPEQLLNQPATAASDQYSLGITFFELFTGELPVRGDHTVAVIAEKLQNRVTRMSDIRSDIPPQLEEVIARMLAHQPGHRYPELRAVAAALHAIRL
jgi:serine/threonine protein kinase